VKTVDGFKDMTHSDTTSKASEVMLIRSAQAGDESAARRLIDLHKDRLFAFVWRMVRHRHDAEEICQDAFMRAFSSLDTFDEQFRFSTWLFTIGYRLALNCIRRRSNAVKSMDTSSLSLPDPAANEDVAEQVAGSEQAKHVKKLIWEEVDRLSPLQRACLLLFYKQGHSCQQVAEMLGVPVSTVKSHMHRARLKLRKRLEAESISDLAALRFGE